MIHQFSKQYIAAAQALVKQGYEPCDNPGSVIAQTFVKDGEELYLYSPLVSDSFYYRVNDRPGWEIDPEEKVVYYPRGTVDPQKATKGANRPWMPRLYDDRPIVFSISDAAEHVGLSVYAIRAAIYREGHKNPLVPSQQLGDRKVIIFTDEDLFAWAEKRTQGSPRSKRYRTKSLLSTMSRDSLAALAKRELNKGELNREPINHLLIANGYSPADVEAASVEDVYDALRGVPRMSLVEVLAQ